MCRERASAACPRTPRAPVGERCHATDLAEAAWYTVRSGHKRRASESRRRARADRYSCSHRTVVPGFPIIF